jgi:hypothetical protein
MIDEDLKELIEGTAAATRRHVETMVEGLRQDVQRIDARLGQESTETRQQFGDAISDMRRHFDITTTHFRGQVQLVAEGVIHGNERLERLAHEIKAEFAETRAMMHLADAELDRRLRSLEERVERLEPNTPH